MGNSFKKNLRDELDFQGLTVKELSAKTDIAKGTLDCYLGTRASMPPADVAVKIARVLGVSVEHLVAGRASRDTSCVSATASLRAIVHILGELDAKDQETMLGFAKVLQKQAHPAKGR